MLPIPYNLYINQEKLNEIFAIPTSKQDKLLTCGILGIELSARLLQTAQSQDNEINAGLPNGILNGINKQLSLIKTYTNSNQGNHAVFQPSYLSMLDHSTQNEIKALTNDRENRIIDIESLENKKLFNSEDDLFMTIHQISECWFSIGLSELESLREKLLAHNISELTPYFNSVTDILAYLSDHIHLLQHMVLADYHPLRVALRGASGGQSEQAHQLMRLLRQCFTAFLEVLNAKQLEILTILEQPIAYPKFYIAINQFQRLERAIKNFFFQHYTLSSSVIGSQSFGSIGHDLITLTNRFVEPLFKEIDDAKYDFTLKTNFQYGKTAGQIILEKEDHYPQHPKGRISQEIISNTITQYFDAISALEADRWIKLFAENGYIEDPVGSRPYLGHKELAIFFKGVMRFFKELTMSIEETKYHSYGAEVHWEAQAKTYHDKPLVFKGVEKFTVNGEGKILAAEVVWNPAVIAEQL